MYSVLHTRKYLKEEPAYSDMKEAVVVLNMMASINMNNMCEEFCIITPTLEMFLNKESKQIVAVSDTLCQIFLVGDRGLKFYTITLVYTLFLCATITRNKFSQYELLLEK